MTSPEDGVRRTIGRYCHTCDDGRFDEFAELFTADAEFAVMGRVHQGRDAIVAFMAEAQPAERRGKHVTSNTVIDVTDGGRSAAAVTDYLFVTRDHTILSVGRYHDVLVCGDDGGWRFARREIVFLGDEPA